MKEIEKYLDAIAAAIDAKDRKAIVLLEPFATHVYHDLYARVEEASGEERTALEGMLSRVKILTGQIARFSLDIW